MPVPVSQPSQRLFNFGDVVALRDNYRDKNAPLHGRGIIVELPGEDPAYPWCYQVSFGNGYSQWYMPDALRRITRATPYIGIDYRHFEIGDTVTFDASTHATFRNTNRAAFIGMRGIIRALPGCNPSQPTHYMVKFKKQSKARFVHPGSLRLVSSALSPTANNKGSPSG